MAKKRKPIAGDFFDKEVPTEKEVNKIVKKTSKPPAKVIRKKFTTMLSPELIAKLKIEAINRKKSAADLLEEILKKSLK